MFYTILHYLLLHSEQHETRECTVKRTILLSVLLSLSTTSTAAVYQCKGDKGQTVFSGQPCGDDAVKLDHNPAPALGGSMFTEGSRDFWRDAR